jgi:hypothetical protein
MRAYRKKMADAFRQLQSMTGFIAISETSTTFYVDHLLPNETLEGSE